jgi:hypothetical protein
MLEAIYSADGRAGFAKRLAESWSLSDEEPTGRPAIENA